MASGPGRALARVEDLFDELAWREQADVAVLCLETTSGAAGGDRREGGTALRGPGVEGHVPDRAARPRSAARCRSRPAWSRPRCTSCTSSASTRPGCATAGAAARSPRWPRTIPPRSDAPTTRCCTAAPCTCGSRARTRRSPTSRERLPSSASDAFGTPFGELLEAANWNFYDIDPLLFSPAAVTLTSTESGRAHHGGKLAPDVLERSFER